MPNLAASVRAAGSRRAARVPCLPAVATCYAPGSWLAPLTSLERQQQDHTHTDTLSSFCLLFFSFLGPRRFFPRLPDRLLLKLFHKQAEKCNAAALFGAALGRLLRGFFLNGREKMSVAGCWKAPFPNGRYQTDGLLFHDRSAAPETSDSLAFG